MSDMTNLEVIRNAFWPWLRDFQATDEGFNPGPLDAGHLGQAFEAGWRAGVESVRKERNDG